MNEKCNTTIDYGFDDGLRLERVSHIVPAAEGTENKLSNDGKGLKSWRSIRGLISTRTRKKKLLSS